MRSAVLEKPPSRFTARRADRAVVGCSKNRWADDAAGRPSTARLPAGRTSFDLSGRVAVVTGGNSGIGAGIAAGADPGDRRCARARHPARRRPVARAARAVGPTQRPRGTRRVSRQRRERVPHGRRADGRRRLRQPADQHAGELWASSSAALRRAPAEVTARSSTKSTTTSATQSAAGAIHTLQASAHRRRS